MALTASNMIDLGTKAPDFTLPDVSTGMDVSFSEVKGEKGTLVMFICNHCPYVVHLFREIVDLSDEYIKNGYGVVAISSNDVVNYPQDSPDKMAIVAKVLKFGFPYLYDESQGVAHAYDAACTPDFYVYDADDLLRYRGRMDNSRPESSVPVTGKDLREAMDHIMQGIPVSETQFPSMGCGMKWKK